MAAVIVGKLKVNMDGGPWQNAVAECVGDIERENHVCCYLLFIEAQISPPLLLLVVRLVQNKEVIATTKGYIILTGFNESGIESLNWGPFKGRVMVII